MKKVVIFDFDHTITKKDSFNDFLKYTFKNKFYFVMLKSALWIILYKFNIISNAKVKTKIFQSFYKNKDYNQYSKDCQKYVQNQLDNIIKDNMKNLISSYHNNKYQLILLSASFKEWLEPWAKKNNFDKVICSSFVINNNVIDGNILENYSCYSKNKLKMLKENVPDILYYEDIIAYGDSKSDKYFMDIANQSYLVKNNKIILLNEYAIVTDGLWRKSVSAIRSLGKKNINVIVTGDTYLSTGMWSRYCTKKVKIPSVNNDSKLFGQKLVATIKKCLKKPVLFPMEEATILWCSENYNLIKDISYILLPPNEAMKIALSKSLTIKHALKEKIPCPKTYFPKNADELQNIIKEEQLSDYVIKPYHGSGSAGLLYGESSQDVDLKDHWKQYGELILQERIPSDGDGVGVSIIMDRSHNVKAYFAHRRVEQYPNSGGPSTQRIGINNPDLVNKSIKLLKSLDWVGVAMVEWKYNKTTNEYVLMEINPRFWGSLELAVRSGVDFPYLYYQLAKNRDVEEITNYDTTYNCRWLLPGDILRYLTKKDRESLPKFCHNMLKNAEEWDKTDKRGFLASIWCQALLIINPKYWKYIRK